MAQTKGYMKKNNKLIALIILIVFCSCGHDHLKGPAQSGASSDLAVDISNENIAFGNKTISDIVIADIEGLAGIAFLVIEDPPSVIAVDVDARPMRISTVFAGLDVPVMSGKPRRLQVIGPDLAFLLTSSAVIVFNPRLGTIFNSSSVVEGITIGAIPRAEVIPTNPTDLVYKNGRLFVSSANEANGFVNSGTIQVFNMGDDGYLERDGYVETTCARPYEMSLIGTSGVAVVNLGSDSQNSCVDIIDITSLAIRHTIEVDEVASSVATLAVTFDGSRGFLNTDGQAVQLDFMNNREMDGFGGSSLNIAISSDNATLFMLDGEHASVVPVDMSNTPPRLLPALALLGEGGIISGKIAVRPGTRGRDFYGEDLLVAVNTTKGAQLFAMNSGRDAKRPYNMQNADTAEAENDSGGLDTPITPPIPPPPPPPPVGDAMDPCQGFVQAVLSYRLGAGSGFGEDYLSDIVLGPPSGAGAYAGSLDVLSLGEHGEIILDLGNCHAVDGPGADFIVFENAFLISGDPASPNKELATVGVSMDGVTFVDYECAGDEYPYAGCAGWHAVYSNPRNDISPFNADEAGGDAFDLADIGLSEIGYIRIRDRDGDGVGTKSGFDLDAVAVVNGVIE